MTNIMKSGDLPKEKAFEPNEEAYQPMVNSNMPPITGQNTSKKLTFAKNIDLSQNSSLQTSSSYKDVLSQPATCLSHSQKMLWLQKRRTTGLWVQCDNCDRWRYMSDIIDRHELPKKWVCSMNTDPEFASCSVPEAPLCLHDEEDLIHSEYSAGSLVWAHLTGWPWWPAMVDDCPDVEQYYWLDGFSDIPTHYHVVFFDNVEATRAWISADNLKPYSANKITFKHLLKNKKYQSRLKVAVSQADAAQKMALTNRLEEFSFISRHKGNINTPKKINKDGLKQYQRRFKNKYNVELPIELSDSDEDNDVGKNSTVMNMNVIMLGTPKRARKEERQRFTESDKIIESESINKEHSEMTNVKQNSKDRVVNSMSAQVGSTEATTIDFDTSTTYLPINESENHTSGRIETTNSDDFDF